MTHLICHSNREFLDRPTHLDSVQHFSLKTLIRLSKIIIEFEGDVTTVYTPNVYAYEYFGLEVAYKDFVVFSVRACSDIHVALVQIWVSRYF